MAVPSAKAVFSLAALYPVAQRFDERRGPIPEPAVELGDLLELLSAFAGHRDKPAGEFRKAGHIAPELLELRHRHHIFLPLPPTFLHVFEGNIAWHTRRQ